MRASHSLGAVGDDPAAAAIAATAAAAVPGLAAVS